MMNPERAKEPWARAGELRDAGFSHLLDSRGGFMWVLLFEGWGEAHYARGPNYDPGAGWYWPGESEAHEIWLRLPKGWPPYQTLGPALRRRSVAEVSWVNEQDTFWATPVREWNRLLRDMSPEARIGWVVAEMLR